MEYVSRTRNTHAVVSRHLTARSLSLFLHVFTYFCQIWRCFVVLIIYICPQNNITIGHSLVMMLDGAVFLWMNTCLSSIFCHLGSCTWSWRMFPIDQHWHFTDFQFLHSLGEKKSPNNLNIPYWLCLVHDQPQCCDQKSWGVTQLPAAENLAPSYMRGTTLCRTTANRGNQITSE